MKHKMVKTSVTILLALITFIGLVSCKPRRTYMYDKESQELAHMLTGKYSGISINGGTRDDLLPEKIYQTISKCDAILGLMGMFGDSYTKDSQEEFRVNYMEQDEKHCSIGAAP